MKSYYIIFSISLIMLSSCGQTIKGEKHNVDVKFEKSYSYVEASDIFENSYETVLLDNSTQDAIIKNTDRILFAEDNIVIVDKLGNKLLLFDNKGEFITSTSNLIGKGNNEYIRISDAALDEKEQKIYLYCNAPYQIMVFDYNLQYERNIKLDFLAFEIAVDDNYIYLTRYNESSMFDLVAIDKHDATQKPLMILEGTKGVRGLTGLGKSLIASNEDIYLCFPFDYNIYRINNGNVVDMYSMDFGTKGVSDINIRRMGNDEFVRKYRGYVWCLQNFCTTDSTLIFTTNTPGLFIYNKEREICSAYNELLHDILPIFSSLTIPSQGKSGHIIFDARPELILNYLNHLQKHGEIEQDSTITKVLESVDMGSNPLIVAWKIK